MGAFGRKLQGKSAYEVEARRKVCIQARYTYVKKNISAMTMC